MTKNSALNTYATLIYFFLQWLTTIAVVHLAGFANAGIYGLALSFCNLFLFFANYGVRTYQVSNVNGEHTAGSYVAMRGITSTVAVMLFFLFVLLMGFDAYVLQCYIATMIFKITESFTDVLYGNFQLVHRYRAIALSYTAKGISTFACFAGGLLWLHSLPIAILLMALANLLVMLFYDLPVYCSTPGQVRKARSKDLRAMAIACFPLMLYTMVLPYMNFITRYAVELRYTRVQVGYYTSVSVVVVVFTTLASAVWSVIAGWARGAYNDGEYRSLALRIAKILLGLACVGAVAVLAGVLWGEWALGLVFGAAIRPYAYLLPPVLVASILLSVATFFSVLLVSFKKRIPMLLANILGAVFCTLAVFPLIDAFGMRGAVYALGSGMAVQALLSGGMIGVVLLKMKSSST